MIDTLTAIAPGWVWAMLGFLFFMSVWFQGADEDSDPDPVIRVLRGVVSTLGSLLNIAAGILDFLINLMIVAGGKARAGLARIGAFIEENVTIEVVLDGTFWRLVLVVVLIGTGYLTWSELGF